MWWKVFELIISFCAGYFVGAYGVIQIIIILRVSFPNIKHYEKQSIMDGKKARSFDRLSILLIGTISVIITVGFMFLNIYWKVGYLAGIVFVLLTGIRLTRENSANLANFVNNHKRFVYEGKLESFEKETECYLKMYGMVGL